MTLLHFDCKVQALFVTLGVRQMKQIRLTQGLHAMVEDRDYEFLSQWKWCASLESNGTKWYAIRWVRVNGKQKKVRMHRAVVERHLGPIPPKLVVDHVNGNSLDNRLYVDGEQQLEVITAKENNRRGGGWKRNVA